MLLNSLPVEATAKVTLFNRRLSRANLGDTLMLPM